jgi:hypothetical protein
VADKCGQTVGWHATRELDWVPQRPALDVSVRTRCGRKNPVSLDLEECLLRLTPAVWAASDP